MVLPKSLWSYLLVVCRDKKLIKEGQFIDKGTEFCGSRLSWILDCEFTADKCQVKCRSTGKACRRFYHYINSEILVIEQFIFLLHPHERRPENPCHALQTTLFLVQGYSKKLETRWLEPEPTHSDPIRSAQVRVGVYLLIPKKIQVEL